MVLLHIHSYTLSCRPFIRALAIAFHSYYMRICFGFLSIPLYPIQMLCIINCIVASCMHVCVAGWLVGEGLMGVEWMSIYRKNRSMHI